MITGDVAEKRRCTKPHDTRDGAGEAHDTQDEGAEDEDGLKWTRRRRGSYR